MAGCTFGADRAHLNQRSSPSVASCLLAVPRHETEPEIVSNSERGYHVFSDVGTKLEFVGFNEAVHVRVATDIFSRIGLTRCLSDPYIPSADVATSSLEIRVAIR